MPNLRAQARLLLLLLTLGEELLRFAWLRLRRGPSLTLYERARWMSDGCAHILRRLGLGLTQSGQPPLSGLIVSNHLSHLDILFYAAATPCVFLSKAEVKSWPLIGLLGRCGGTLFVERERATSAVRAVEQVRQALEAGVSVVLFPEGTSTDGTTVLPFRPMIFQAAIEAGAPVTASAVAHSADGAEEAELCYFGDRSFGPHFAKCLGLEHLRGSILWPVRSQQYESRKQAAIETHAAVVSARGLLEAAKAQPASAAGLIGLIDAEV